MSQITPPPPTPDRRDGQAPRWVKVFWVVGILVALMVVVMLVSGGKHGPGRHLGGAEHLGVAYAYPSATPGRAS
jgi:hypothetical protein